MPQATISIDLQQTGGVIRPELYGHSIEHRGSCINGGIWVGEDSPIPNFGGIRTDILDALRQIHPPILRWPGGAFADDYHWEDGIGPRANRPRRINWADGQSIEPNGFGVHEYIQVCKTLGAEPYLAANLHTGTLRELQEWVEYCNFAGESTLARRRAANGSAAPFGVRYWILGNRPASENDDLSPEDSAAIYKRFAGTVKKLGAASPLLVAQGAPATEIEWTARFLEKLAAFPQLHALAIPYSCGTAGPSATQFDANQWYELLAKAAGVEQVIKDHRALLERFDPARKLGLVIDNWGTQHAADSSRSNESLWRQNTLRDALVAAITLDIFNRHCDVLSACNIAHSVNALQAMILTQGDKMVLTPTYHVFELYRSHQGGRSVFAEFAAPTSSPTLPTLTGSASIRGDLLTLSVVNTHATDPIEAAIHFKGGALQQATVSVLAHSDLRAHNTFESPQTVKPQTQLWEKKPSHVLPPGSITVLSGRVAS